MLTSSFSLFQLRTKLMKKLDRNITEEEDSIR